jgi:hypothetical protein
MIYYFVFAPHFVCDNQPAVTKLEFHSGKPSGCTIYLGFQGTSSSFLLLYCLQRFSICVGCPLDQTLNWEELEFLQNILRKMLAYGSAQQITIYLVLQIQRTYIDVFSVDQIN